MPDQLRRPYPIFDRHHFFDSRPEFVFTDSRFDKWVLVAPESGRFTYELDNESGEANFGEVVCVPPEGKFLRHVSTPMLTYHVLQWRSDYTLLDESWTPGKWLVSDTTRLMNDFAILRRLHYQLDSFSLYRREVVALDILHLLWETRYVLPKITDPLMQEAATLIQARAREMISMQEISSQIGLGPVQFTRRFYDAYGVNPIKYLTQKRLELAQKMLIESDATIDEIALHCGWSYGSYLSRVFLQHFGITPGEFRKNHRM